MFEVALNSFVAMVIVEAMLLLSGVEEMITYRTKKPDKDRSFDEIRDSDRVLRSVVWPGFATLVTGLLVSLSSSFFYAEFADGKSYAVSIGACLFIAAMVAFLLLLRPILKGEPPLEELARYPQRILLAATEVSGEERDAATRLQKLRTLLMAWNGISGAFSFGWPNKCQSPRLAMALADVPADRALRLRGAWPTLWRRDAFLGAWSTAPWRFGWPLYLLALLYVTGSVGMLVSGKTLSYVFRITLVLGIAGAVSLSVYWSGRLLSMVRLVAIGKWFVGPCEVELERASERVKAAEARDYAWVEMSAQLSDLAMEVKCARRISAGTVVTAALIPVVALLVGSRLR